MQILSGNDNFFIQVVKGVITALVITLLGVLIFAFVLSVTSLSNQVIKPVNQFIKLLAVFFGCFLSVKDGKGFAKGGLIGLLSSILSVLIFGLIAGSFTSFLGVLIDVAFGFLMGGISGIISASVRKY